jgi:hypothetical protein
MRNWWPLLHHTPATPSASPPTVASETSAPPSEDQVLACATCSESFVWTRDDQLRWAERGWVPPKRCPGCQSRRRAAIEAYARREAVPKQDHYETVGLRCISCGATYEFTSGEQRFMADRGLSTPRRCGPCREERRRR